jgi:hypothetical protein
MLRKCVATGTRQSDFETIPPRADDCDELCTDAKLKMESLDKGQGIIISLVNLESVCQYQCVETVWPRVCCRIQKRHVEDEA